MEALEREPNSELPTTMSFRQHFMSNTLDLSDELVS